MARYTNGELKQMARDVVRYEAQGDMLTNLLYIQVALNAGTTPSIARNTIHQMAALETI